jgi:hypothetical protein
VRAFSFRTGAPVEVASFFAYDPAYGGGVGVAAADVATPHGKRILMVRSPSDSDGRNDGAR